MDGKQREQNDSTDLTPTMQGDRTRRGGLMTASRCVPCMQGVCCVFVFRDMDSCQDVPQYKVMKYLVFRIILSSLLSEL
jgi:hypothetical protein